MTHGADTAPVRVVLDTNIVLDLWLYKDAATPVLLEALENKAVQWLTTQVMRDELERVLAYAHIVKRLAFSQLDAQDLAQSACGGCMTRAGRYGITACYGSAKCRNASIGAGCYGITASRACTYVSAISHAQHENRALRSFSKKVRNRVTPRTNARVTHFCGCVTLRNCVTDEGRVVK